MATATSVKAYQDHAERSAQQREFILTQIQAAGAAGTCIADLAWALGWQKSTVSARMNELKAAGAIVLAGQRKSNSTGIRADHFRTGSRDCLFGDIEHAEIHSVDISKDLGAVQQANPV